MIKLVKILPSQGQTPALWRMFRASLQTKSFKANNQILTKVDTVQKFGSLRRAKEAAVTRALTLPTTSTIY